MNDLANVSEKLDLLIQLMTQHNQAPIQSTALATQDDVPTVADVQVQHLTLEDKVNHYIESTNIRKPLQKKFLLLLPLHNCSTATCAALCGRSRSWPNSIAKKSEQFREAWQTVKSIWIDHVEQNLVVASDNLDTTATRALLRAHKQEYKDSPQTHLHAHVEYTEKMHPDRTQLERVKRMQEVSQLIFGIDPRTDDELVQIANKFDGLDENDNEIIDGEFTENE